MNIEAFRRRLAELQNGELKQHFEAIDETAVNAFYESLKFKDGFVVHADFRPLLGKITEKGLVRLFASLGVSSEKFARVRDSACVSGVCFVQPGAYCDPERCH